MRTLPRRARPHHAEIVCHELSVADSFSVSSGDPPQEYTSLFVHPPYDMGVFVECRDRVRFIGDEGRERAGKAFDGRAGRTSLEGEEEEGVWREAAQRVAQA